MALDGLEVHLENFEGRVHRVLRVPHRRRGPGAAVPGPARRPLSFPRWGTSSREITFRLRDHDERYQAGEAYYVPPGHTPIHHAGARIVEFSPTEPLGETIGVVMANLAATRSSTG